MKKIFFFLALFICFHRVAICQTNNPVIENATLRLKTLLTDHIAEKVYLHFDRPYPYYVAGDIVYFKAYVTKGEQHELSNISGIVHVDLINHNDVLMQSIILQLNNGMGWGDFALPDTLQKGNYRIRAYTEWMRNDKKPNYFEHPISVSSINSVDRVSENVKHWARPDFRFFPEGGNLVTGIHSRVAFKAVGPDGLGVDVKGTVVDDVHKEVAKIASSHLGMGVFDFTPEEGRKYSAKITFADGSQTLADFPAVEEKGLTLAVNTDDPAKVGIEIKANLAYFKENKDKELNILVYSTGGMRTVTTKLDSRVLGLDLPTSNFRTGILQVTVLSQTGEPLNERMAFIQNADQLNLSLSTNKAVYAKRENVQLNLNAKNKDGNPVNGYFSVSVIDESKILVDENSENTILSYLLLTSDIKGYVEKPNYYFSNVTKETRANLDAVMLTHGYRRFVWKEILNNNTAANTHIPEMYLNISGQLKSKDGMPLANGKITLLDKATGSILTQTTDAQGKFNFTNMSYYSGSSFVLTSKPLYGKNASIITLNSPVPMRVRDTANLVDAKYDANADILASLKSTQNARITANYGATTYLLKEDKTTGAALDDSYRSANLGGSGHADQVIKGEKVKNASSLSSGLNGLARGVEFIQGVPYLKGGNVISMGKDAFEPMLLVIDGVQTTGTVDIINPNLVETIEILKGANASIYGNRGGPGVLVITTRQGESLNYTTSKEMSPGIFFIEPKGFYKAREFYSPVYDASQPVNKVPDLRTTIFWKPDVTTDTGGNASFNYFNADGTGTYRVVVEGIDGKGNLGRQVFRYKVE